MRKKYEPESTSQKVSVAGSACYFGAAGVELRPAVQQRWAPARASARGFACVGGQGSGGRPPTTAPRVTTMRGWTRWETGGPGDLHLPILDAEGAAAAPTAPTTSHELEPISLARCTCEALASRSRRWRSLRACATCCSCAAARLRLSRSCGARARRSLHAGAADAYLARAVHVRGARFTPAPSALASHRALAPASRRAPPPECRMRAVSCSTTCCPPTRPRVATGTTTAAGGRRPAPPVRPAPALLRAATGTATYGAARTVVYILFPILPPGGASKPRSKWALRDSCTV